MNDAVLWKKICFEVVHLGQLLVNVRDVHRKNVGFEIQIGFYLFLMHYLSIWNIDFKLTMIYWNTCQVKCPKVNVLTCQKNDTVTHSIYKVHLIYYLKCWKENMTQYCWPCTLFHLFVLSSLSSYSIIIYITQINKDNYTAVDFLIYSAEKNYLSITWSITAVWCTWSMEWHTIFCTIGYL